MRTCIHIDGYTNRPKHFSTNNKQYKIFIDNRNQQGNVETCNTKSTKRAQKAQNKHKISTINMKKKGTETRNYIFCSMLYLCCGPVPGTRRTFTDISIPRLNTIFELIIIYVGSKFFWEGIPQHWGSIPERLLTIG